MSMTIEQAIRILDPETTVEALAEIEYYNGFSGQTAKVQACSEACEVAVAALREQLICQKNPGEASDGYHTFNELYHHRAVLFSVICNMHPLCAWKARKHNDGTMYDGMFIVGINTPSGQASYHYDITPYWDMFRVPEMEFAPVWDGHTPNEAIQRIGTLDKEDVVRCKDCKHWHEETGWCTKHSHFIGRDGMACHPSQSSEWKMFNADDFCSSGERRGNE